ncbi:helix-turn-helix domain-containing GNAT family N-acetyltransferase [Spirillospora sp. NPDC047279]|uniref:bifunctional helix-turn-helix transcriptional regulator/GNAT family N-acetyltransferase n=1 Tax=Spirillospora sp. NPDC047279 TaxID=3155478 RepID=UPI0033F97583
MTAVEQIRHFNRTVTQRVGALHDAFLARSRPLGQARLLWEIGPDGARVRDLRSRLDLDSGYVSRLLRALEADGLAVVHADPADARTRVARLTPAGLAERRELDRLSDEQAASILAPLSERQRDRLVAAMTEVERLLTASLVDIAVTDPDHPHARHCERAYFAELAERFEGGFDAATYRAAEDGGGLLLIATLHGEPVACGALKPGAIAKIKRMWVAPPVRALGLGRRLLGELEAQAAARGATAVRLETNRALTEAIGLYRAAGYREVDVFSDEPYAHHWFEKTLPGGPGS